MMNFQQKNQSFLLNLDTFNQKFNFYGFFTYRRTINDKRGS